MEERLQDTSPSAMEKAIEESLFAFYENLSCSSLFEVHLDADMLWTLTDVSDWSMFNSIVRAQLDKECIGTAIEAVIARGRSRNVPLMWWVGPETRPANISDDLNEHGFELVDESPGMAVDLLTIPPIPTGPSDLIINQVQDIESLKIWCQVSAAGFEMTNSAEHAWMDAFNSIGLGTNVPFRHYLGWLKGEAVATSSLLLDAGVAGIYNVATLPMARRLGIGFSISLTSLHEARSIGYRISVLQSSEMAVGVYRRLGFKEYCKIDCYQWATEHPNGNED
jgi:ribosomal protein S18 acetylase RimI-like enzyme